jgi:hypothetical protein
MIQKNKLPETITESDGLISYVYKLAINVLPKVDYDEEGVPFIVGTDATLLFVDRYNKNKIDINFTYEGYLNNEAIQSTLTALGLDSEKFWFLLLFVFDYCKGICLDGYGKSVRGREQIQKLINAIDGIAEYAKLGNVEIKNAIHLTKDATITLKIKGKHSIEIKDHLAIYYVALFCEEGLKYLEPESLLNTAYINTKEITEFESDEVLIWQFAMLFRKFFDIHPTNNKRQKKTDIVSYSKTLLISKLIYFTKLSRNKKFQEEEYKLKDILKRHKEDNIKKTNSIYFF